MPDTWTTNPPKLREALTGLGAKCGRESRVLKPRDPEWTCHMDSPAWQGDIYIHPMTDLYSSNPAIRSPIVVALIVGIFIGLLWGRRFWRSSATS